MTINGSFQEKRRLKIKIGQLVDFGISGQICLLLFDTICHYIVFSRRFMK